MAVQPNPQILADSIYFSGGYMGTPAIPSLTYDYNGIPQWDKFFADGRLIQNVDNFSRLLFGDLSVLPKYQKATGDIEAKIRKIREWQADIKWWADAIVGKMNSLVGIAQSSEISSGLASTALKLFLKSNPELVPIYEVGKVFAEIVSAGQKSNATTQAQIDNLTAGVQYLGKLNAKYEADIASYAPPKDLGGSKPNPLKKWLVVGAIVLVGGILVVIILKNNKLQEQSG